MVMDRKLKRVGLRNIYNDKRLELNIEINDKSKDKTTGEKYIFGTAYYKLKNGKSKAVPFELVYTYGDIHKCKLHQDNHTLTYGLQKLLRNKIENYFYQKW